MINAKLFLNKNLLSKNVKKVPTRNGYGEGLVELGKKNKNIVVLCADLANSTRVAEFCSPENKILINQTPSTFKFLK